MPSILTPPDIDYTDENGNKVFVEFGSFLGISLKFNGEKVKASPAKYKDVRKQNKKLINKNYFKNKVVVETGNNRFMLVGDKICCNDFIFELIQK